jgi:glycosyltransferase involved in cell wall biosynthesis
MDFIQKRILIDGRLLSTANTGISRYTKELIHFYTSTYPQCAITVINSKAFNLPNDKVSFVKTGLKPYRLTDFFLIYFLLKKIKPDVYHTAFYSNSFFKLKKCVYVTTVHDMMYSLVPHFFSRNALLNYLAVQYYHLITRRSIQHSDVVLAVSATTADDIKKITGKEAFVVKEGINSLQDDETVRNTTRQTTLEYKKYYLYAGNLRVQKNIPFLVKNFLKIDTDKKLVLAGPFNPKDFYHQYTEAKGKIIALGFVNDAELKALYKNCYGFIYPSLYEGFGLPVLEALQFQIPVLCSTGGALKEFNHLPGIYYFNPSDDVGFQNLIKQKKLSPPTLNETKTLSEMYSWKLFSSKLKQIIDPYVR